MRIYSRAALGAEGATRSDMGSQASDPGRAGSAVVQVVNSGAGGSNHFDCFIDGFLTITSSSTGIFPIQFSHVNCQRTTTPTHSRHPSREQFILRQGSLFGGITGVASAKVRVGGAWFPMTRNSGATFYAQTNGAKGQSSFEVSYDNGNIATIDGCFGGAWPVQTSSVCT